jgi:hypothetical protein
MAMTKQTEYIIAGLFLLLIAGIAYMSYTGVKPSAPVSVACGPILSQVYGLAGQAVSEAVKVLNAVNNNPVQGANIYVFSTQPYYWGQPQVWSLASSMVLGQTPAAVTGTQGNATLQVTIPSGNQTTTEYVIITAPGYWTELYTLTTGFNPLFSASSEQQCIQLYPYSTIQNLLPSLIQVQAQNVLTGKVVSLNQITLEPIGSLVPNITTISLGVNSNQFGASLKGGYIGFVSGGSLRITGIKLIGLNMSNAGIQQVSLTITANGQTLYNGVVYNALNSNLPLGSGSGTYTISVPNGVVEIPNGGQLQIQLQVIANTNTEQVAGYLYPGEQFMQIQLQLADPMQNSPITFTVTG